ncbi:hypothetical protein DMB92_01265 [Campylobacter sp. MIT 99-7217]|uniref:divergent polysaccharide deacetylase family protein n=1 Tax=Campylobacter sp. MIT 99-7217 TaxID=535091 RepID=UPI0011570BFE|nr:divergent polysaccharide deacetylase family protein [Campylobacter sp. MIT 99-7217]TQR34621.1 hypothetical protein DMB92_01265 [Campylobacter sp. MIT 99-7217]
MKSWFFWVLLLGIVAGIALSFFIPTQKINLEVQNSFIPEKNTTLEQNHTQTTIKKGLFADYEEGQIQTHTEEIVENNTSIKELNISKIIEFNLSKDQIFDHQSLYFKAPNYFQFDLKDYKKTEQNSSKKDENLSTPTNLDLNTTKKPLVKTKHKGAKLAIIIDDMASATQVRNLKNTKLKLIPSFFPRDKNHPLTPQYAKEFKFFMVHLPLAAFNFKNEETQTLSPQDTQERIDEKIAEIYKDFENLKFINNHTGSLFTSDEEAMRKLFRAFERYGFVFVDSVTIGKSKGEKISKEFGQIPIKRDIFLDNQDSVAYIKKQLQKAVHLAQKKGFAIAIGHPRKNTFKALVESKDLLESVELVYLNEIYKEQ